MPSENQPIATGYMLRLGTMMTPKAGFVLLSLFAILGAVSATTVLLAVETSAVPKELKQITVFLEGDSSTAPKLINILRQMGPEYGLNFNFVDKKEDAY